MKKRLLAGFLTTMIAVTLLPQSLFQNNVKAAVTLQDPRIVVDTSMEADQKVTYDCVWFGSYPQTEIVDQASTSGVYGKPWAQSSDYEENISLYNTLKNSTGWDNNGDVTLSGTKYRRIKSVDVSFLSEDSNDYYYYWNSSDEYHYFRYEPIKWRVLDVDSSGTQALLLADKVLDVKEYNTLDENITWKTSTIRSWLNGYGSSANAVGADYSSKNFINLAFTSPERGAIESTYLDNKTTGRNTENYGGDNTSDKVFLLSHYDMYYSNVSASYGFYKADDVNFDEARRRKGSPYAMAMGIWINASSKYLGNCLWWLRSPGSVASYAAYIHDSGSVNLFGYDAYDNGTGVCPALKLNLLSADLYSYAGTVCTDGTVHEEDYVDVNYTITYDANKGYDAPESQIKRKGAEITLSNSIPKREGYDFMGWGLDNESTMPTYQPGQIFSKDENVTLYALWKNDITLSYDANGGYGAPPPQMGTVYNSKSGFLFTISTVIPLREGYTFLGWSENPSATSVTYKSGGLDVALNDEILYAVWQKKQEEGGESGGDAPVNPEPIPVVKKVQNIIASDKKVAINNAAFYLNAKASGNGTMTYKSSNTKVAIVSSTGKITVKGYGISTITITSSETSTYRKATKSVFITVVPKKMKLKSVKSPGKGKLQARWIKDKAASGYQIQFSRDLNFKKGVYQKNISKKLTTLKKPVTGLDRKKKYYVRIRAYKKVNGKNLLGIWSYGKVVKIN